MTNFIVNFYFCEILNYIFYSLRDKNPDYRLGTF